MCWLGGDHSITLPLMRAYTTWLGRPLAVIHFDAHCDTWQDHFGEPSGHGTWVFEAIREGLSFPSASRNWAFARPARAKRANTCAIKAGRSSRRANCAGWRARHNSTACWVPCARGWRRTATLPST